jgi:DNA endonuclease
MEGQAPARSDIKSTDKDTDKGRRPPLDTRILLHEKALMLRKNSHTFQQIIDKIEHEHGVRLTESTISNWTRGISTPLRAGRVFIPKPTPDLAYVIGVETGDAFLNVKLRSYQYRIRLKAVDREFAEAFNQAVSRVLGCPPHRLWKGSTEKETYVEFGSYLLHKFLLQKLQDLKQFIEYNKECVAAFVRGFLIQREVLTKQAT